MQMCGEVCMIWLVGHYQKDRSCWFLNLILRKDIESIRTPFFLASRIYGVHISVLTSCDQKIRLEYCLAIKIGKRIQTLCTEKVLISLTNPLFELVNTASAFCKVAILATCHTVFEGVALRAIYSIDAIPTVLTREIVMSIVGGVLNSAIGAGLFS